MRSWTVFHEANKESVAQWMFKCVYEDLKEPGKMDVDDLIAKLIRLLLDNINVTNKN